MYVEGRGERGQERGQVWRSRQLDTANHTSHTTHLTIHLHLLRIQNPPPPNTAPNQHKTDEKADVWSVGVVAYQLLTGKLPFWTDVRGETLADVWKAILSYEIDWEAAPGLAALSPAARAFLARLLARNPAARPSAAEALADPWLAAGGGDGGGSVGAAAAPAADVAA